MKVLDSNVFSNASGHTYSITPQRDGTTDLDVDLVREGKNLKGRVISLVVSTIGKPSLAKALHGTVKPIEARNARKLEIASAPLWWRPRRPPTRAPPFTSRRPLLVDLSRAIGAFHGPYRGSRAEIGPRIGPPWPETIVLKTGKSPGLPGLSLDRGDRI
jgi:hypothetical protein